MSIKDNINKIHIDLLDNFEDVSILEKSNSKWGNYFELIISESSKSIKVLVTKKDIENKSFNWRYYSNINNDNSQLVERNCNVGDFHLIIKDIFEKNRFDLDYLKSLNS